MPKLTNMPPWIKTLICFILFIWTLCVFFPGSYSVDSWKQYNQMIAGKYDDWYEPSLAYLWHGLWLITGTYLSLYVLQMLLYWVFIALLVRNMLITSVGFWVAIVVGVFYTFIPQYIMRDSFMAIAWGIAAILLLAKVQQLTISKTTLIVIILLTGVGLWVRPNTVIAAMPVITGVLIAARPDKKIGWKQLALSIILPLTFVMVMQAFNYRILHTSKAYPTYKLKLLDIAGISKLSGTNYMPGNITSYPTFNYDTLINKYTPASFDDFYWPPDNEAPLVPQPDATLNDSVSRSWKKAVTAHPLLYMQNRIEGFLYYLRIKKRFKGNEYWNVAIWIDPNNPLHLETTPNAMRDKFGGNYAKLYGTWFYDTWFWLVLNLVAFSLFVYLYKEQRNNYWLIHGCIQLSGILYVLSQLPVYQHDRDFRYTYWNLFVVLIALSAIWGRKKIAVKQNEGDDKELI